MSGTTEFEKTPKSKQYLKITMSEITDLKQIQILDNVVNC